jgi:hypothetical protein
VLWKEYSLGIKIQEDEMGGAIDMYTERKERSFEGFGWEN